MEEFIDVLRWQNNRPACWFCVQHTRSPTISQKCLADLFGQGQDEFFEQLTKIGLVYKHGKTWRIKHSLLNAVGIMGNITNFEIASFSLKGQSRSLYLRLGFFEGGHVFTPEGGMVAFQSFQKAPVRLIDEFCSRLTSAGAGTANGTSTKKDSECKNGGATTGDASQEEGHSSSDLTIRFLELLQPLLIPEGKKLCTTGKMWKLGIRNAELEAALAPLVGSMHSKKSEKAGERLSQVSSPASQVYLTNDTSKYKVLSGYGVPLTKASTTAVLYDLIKLQKEAMDEKGIDIFSVPNPQYKRQMMSLVLV